MSEPVRPVYLAQGIQAEALGAALRRLGFTAEVLVKRGHERHPCVVVTSGPARFLEGAGYVYAAPDNNGAWWFWWSSSLAPLATERVAPLSDVSRTADHIARIRARARAASQASWQGEAGA